MPAVSFHSHDRSVRRHKLVPWGVFVTVWAMMMSVLILVVTPTAANATFVGEENLIAISEISVSSNVVVNIVNGDVYRNDTILTPATPGVKFTQVETSSYGSSASSNVYAIDTSGVFWYAENDATTLTRNTSITEPVSSITTGYYGTAFLLTNTGKVYATGRYNSFYDLGTGDQSPYAPSNPRLLSFGGASIKMISAGLFGGHAVDSLGKVWGWSNGSGGRLCNGTGGNTTVPTLITQPALNPGESIVQIDEAACNTTIITNQGRMFEFGHQLGTLGSVIKNVPTLVSVSLPGNDMPVFISRGSYYQSYVIGSSGKLYGWSSSSSIDPLLSNSNGTITTMTALNNMLAPGEKFVDVTFGVSHNNIGAALTSTGRLITWGNTWSPFSPTPVVNKTGVSVKTPPSVTSSNATIVNDSAPTSNLNWNSTTPEKVRYSWTVSNTDATANSAYTNVTPNVTFPNGFACAWTNAPTSVPANSTATYTAECTPPQSYYNSTTAPTTTLPGLDATFAGTWNNTANTQTSGTTNTLPVQTVFTRGTATETVSMGTPDGGTVGQVGLGDQVRYTTTINNTGTTTLTKLRITSPTFTNNQFNYAQTCPTSIAPGTSGSCVTTFTAAPNTVATTPLTNVSTVYATPTYGSTELAEATLVTNAQNTIVVERASLSLTSPVLTIVTDVAPTGLSAGDTVRWTTTATNTGTVNLRSVTITDQDGRSFGNAAGVSLAPNSALTNVTTPNYVMTVNDATKTPYSETATAKAYLSTCSVNCQEITATTTTNSTIAVYNKTATQTARSSAISNDTAPTGTVNLGDKVTRSVTIRNDGNVAWNAGVNMTDEQGNAYNCTTTAIAVGGTAVCSVTFDATKAMLTSNALSFTPKFTYTPNVGTVTTIELATTTQPALVPVKQLEVTTSSNPSNANPVKIGDTLALSYLVTNTGNLPVTGNLQVTTDDGTIVTCPSNTLAAGASITCTGTKTIE